MAFAPGHSVCARRSEITATFRSRSLSARVRPASSGMPIVRKYSGLTKRTLVEGRSKTGRESPGSHTLSTQVSPFKGRALVMAAEATPGEDARLVTTCSKNAFLWAGSLYLFQGIERSAANTVGAANPVGT